MLKLESITRGFKKAWHTYLDLVKIIIPVYILMIILQHTGAISYLATIFSPLMTFVGLPGEAVMALLTGYLLNLYGAIAVIVSLDLASREITILAIMLGLSHSLLIEGAVMKKMKTNPLTLIALRVGTSILVGIVLNLVL